jgi:hypothetical protein
MDKSARMASSEASGITFFKASFCSLRTPLRKEDTIARRPEYDKLPSFDMVSRNAKDFCSPGATRLDLLVERRSGHSFDARRPNTTLDVYTEIRWPFHSSIWSMTLATTNTITPSNDPTANNNTADGATWESAFFCALDSGNSASSREPKSDPASVLPKERPLTLENHCFGVWKRIRTNLARVPWTLSWSSTLGPTIVSAMDRDIGL